MNSRSGHLVNGGARGGYRRRNPSFVLGGLNAQLTGCVRLSLSPLARNSPPKRELLSSRMKPASGPLPFDRVMALPSCAQVLAPQDTVTAERHERTV